MATPLVEISTVYQVCLLLGEAANIMYTGPLDAAENCKQEPSPEAKEGKVKVGLLKCSILSVSLIVI